MAVRYTTSTTKQATAVTYKADRLACHHQAIIRSADGSTGTFTFSGRMAGDTTFEPIRDSVSGAQISQSFSGLTAITWDGVYEEVQVGISGYNGTGIIVHAAGWD